MARLVQHLSGRVKPRDPADLDSNRYEYLTLDQAEPNLGVPATDGQILISNADGTRSFTSSPTLTGLNFSVASLDSAGPNDFYALFVKGDPFDGIPDSVGVRLIDDTIFEVDTLDTVTSRGSTTTNDITIGALVADSALFNADVVVTGNFTVNGTTTTINSQTLTVDDKNIVIAQGAASAAIADGAGVTVDGANATITYAAATDTWNLNKSTIVESDFTVEGKAFLKNVRTDTTTLSLFLDETTGEIVAGIVEQETGGIDAARITLKSVDDNITVYPVLSAVTNGADSAKVDADFRYNPSTNLLSVEKLELRNIDSSENPTSLLVLTDTNRVGNEPQLQYDPVENVFSVEKLELRGIDSSNTETSVLVITDTNRVAKRDFGDLSLLDSEQDTLQTVTDRGDSSDNAITVRKLTTTDSVDVSTDLQFRGRLLDGNERRLIIYDSAGAVLWG